MVLPCRKPGCSNNATFYPKGGGKAEYCVKCRDKATHSQGPSLCSVQGCHKAGRTVTAQGRMCGTCAAKVPNLKVVKTRWQYRCVVTGCTRQGKDKIEGLSGRVCNSHRKEIQNGVKHKFKSITARGEMSLGDAEQQQAMWALCAPFEGTSNPPERASNPPEQTSNPPINIHNFRIKQTFPTEDAEQQQQAMRALSAPFEGTSNPPEKLSNPPEQLSNLPEQASNPPEQASNPLISSHDFDIQNYIHLQEERGGVLGTIPEVSATGPRTFFGSGAVFFV